MDRPLSPLHGRRIIDLPDAVIVEVWAWLSDAEALRHLRSCKATYRLYHQYETKRVWREAELLEMNCSFLSLGAGHGAHCCQQDQQNRETWSLRRCPRVIRLEGLSSLRLLVWFRHLSELRFHHLFNELVLPSQLPTSLTTLWMGVFFNRPLEAGVFPERLRFLQMSVQFNLPIAPRVLPHSLLILEMPGHFNQLINVGTLPPLLQRLLLGDHFNQPLLPDTLPSSLRSLSLGNSFNQPLIAGVLPAGLCSLSLGNSFNRPLIAGVLPAGLTDLQLGDAFNHPLRRCLSSLACLAVLRLGWRSMFNQLICPGDLPQQLQELDLGMEGCFAQPLVLGSLPGSLRTLNFGDAFDHPIAPTIFSSTPHLQMIRFGRRSAGDAVSQTLLV